MMDHDIALALNVFRNSPQSVDEQIFRVLVKNGMEQRLAARLVEFLPSAYCRIILEPTGARFPDTFQRCRGDGTITPQIPLASEPVWNAALEYARREIGSGLSREDKLNVAGRSPEFQAANNLFQEGSKLQNIVFTPVVHPWPDEGPSLSMAEPENNSELH